MMNTFQLAQVLTKDPFTKGSFSGVYACDELTSIEINEYPKSFVVNTDPMELPGTHWIAIYFAFDSLNSKARRIAVARCWFPNWNLRYHHF